MAAEEEDSQVSNSTWHPIDLPPFKKEVTDFRFVNISIKNYEKKSGTGFKEEYYAYKVVAM